MSSSDSDGDRGSNKRVLNDLVVVGESAKESEADCEAASAHQQQLKGELSINLGLPIVQLLFQIKASSDSVVDTLFILPHCSLG